MTTRVETSGGGGVMRGLLIQTQRRLWAHVSPCFLRAEASIVLLPPTRILHEAELPLKGKKEKMGELKPLLTPECFQMLELDLQLTIIGLKTWPRRAATAQNYLIWPRPLFFSPLKGQDRPQHDKIVVFGCGWGGLWGRRGVGVGGGVGWATAVSTRQTRTQNGQNELEANEPERAQNELKA